MKSQIEVRQVSHNAVDHVREQAKVEGKQVIGVEFLPCNRCRVAIVQAPCPDTRTQSKTQGGAVAAQGDRVGQRLANP